MLKKVLLSLVVCFLMMPIMAKAEGLSDIIAKLPITNAGCYYNINDSQLQFTSTFKAFGYKGFNLNVGYATPEAFVTNVSYEIIKLENIGVDIPILKDLIIDLGWTVAFEEPLNDREFSTGPSVTFGWKW